MLVEALGLLAVPRVRALVSRLLEQALRLAHQQGQPPQQGPPEQVLQRVQVLEQQETWVLSRRCPVLLLWPLYQLLLVRCRLLQLV